VWKCRRSRKKILQLAPRGIVDDESPNPFAELHLGRLDRRAREN